DDGNDCTADHCAPIGGCSSSLEPDGAPCDDLDRCTLFDTCHAGVCTGPDVEVVAIKSAKFGAASMGSGNVSVDSDKGTAKFRSAAFMADDSVVTANKLGIAKQASLFDVATNKLGGPGAFRGSQSTAT